MIEISFKNRTIWNFLHESITLHSKHEIHYVFMYICLIKLKEKDIQYVYIPKLQKPYFYVTVLHQCMFYLFIHHFTYLYYSRISLPKRIDKLFSSIFINIYLSLMISIITCLIRIITYIWSKKCIREIHNIVLSATTFIIFTFLKTFN